MESMIGTLPRHYSIHMSSGYNAAITTKPYCSTHFSTKPRSSFSHSSFSVLPKSTSRGRPLEHIRGPMDFSVSHSLTPLTDQKNRPLEGFADGHLKQVEEVAKELKESGHQDISLQLLKIHDPKLDVDQHPTGYYKIKMQIMEILIAKRRFEDAWGYCEAIEKYISKYNDQFPSDFFNGLQFVILCGLGRHERADELRAKVMANKNASSMAHDNKVVSNSLAENNKDKNTPPAPKDNKDASMPLGEDNKDKNAPPPPKDNKDMSMPLTVDNKHKNTPPPPKDNKDASNALTEDNKDKNTPPPPKDNTM